MLVVFEGFDCTGKTTLIKQISDKFSELKVPHFRVREPCFNLDIYNKDWKNLDEILISPNISKNAKNSLFGLSHAYNHLLIKEQLRLNPNIIILSDRYSFSQYAYSGYSADTLLEPDKIIYLENSFENIIKNDKQRDNEDRDFYDLSKQIEAYNVMASYEDVLKPYFESKKAIKIHTGKNTIKETVEQVLNFICPTVS